MNPFEKESCSEALKKNAPELYEQYRGNYRTVEPFMNVATPPGYTYHGKEHIGMVEQYVGRLLGEDRISKMTNEELFVLLMGVMCHDVGMSEYKTVGDTYIPDRENHNINSYLKVYDSKKNSSGNLGIKVPSDNPKYFKAIALLCLGHRDYKVNGKKKCTLLEQCEIDGQCVGIPELIALPNNTDVHVRYLAAVLRLADEIDVTNQRAPKDIEMHLKNFITDVAKEHWSTHQLFEKVEITHVRGVTTISLIPNKEEIVARSTDKENPISKKQLLRLVFSRRKKIEEEISVINKITRDSSLIKSGLEVEYRVEICFDNDVVTKEDFEEYQKDVDRQQEEENNTSPQKAIDDKDNELVGKKKSPVELFNEDIVRMKRDNNLLETGSFSFSFEKGKNEYTQYFINTQLLLTKRDTLNSITDIFKEHYLDKKIDSVIGIGKAGIILSPNLSLKLDCDSSYLICDWEDTTSVNWEKSSSVIETTQNVVVLLDVISTGTVTKQAIEKIKQKNKTNLDSIYVGTVFCTNNAIKAEIEKIEKVKELFVINDEFQFRTYNQEEYDGDEEFKKEFKLLPLRKK